MKKCAWKDCQNEADPARPGSGPFDDDLCAYHDEIQAGDPPFGSDEPHSTKENDK